MHFENIDRRIVKEHGWTLAKLPLGNAPHETSNLVGEFHFYKSRGRYCYDTVGHGIKNKMHVWFELEEDALYFTLKYIK